jgi:beta-glucosidase
MTNPLTIHRIIIKVILSELTLEEKASLSGGKDFWNLYGIERLNVLFITVTDGPHCL